MAGVRVMECGKAWEEGEKEWGKLGWCLRLWVFLHGEVNRDLRNFPPLDAVLEVADGASHLVYGEIATDPVAGDRVEVFFDDGEDRFVDE